MTLVYRVQDRRGRGPFGPGKSQLWTDEDFAPGVCAYPTWMEEFGPDLILRHGKPGEHFGSAVRQMANLRRWFSDTEAERMKRRGFHIVAVPIERILAESPNQLVFARKKPLWRDVRLIPWSHLS